MQQDTKQHNCFLYQEIDSVARITFNRPHTLDQTERSSRDGAETLAGNRGPD